MHPLISRFCRKTSQPLPLPLPESLPPAPLALAAAGPQLAGSTAQPDQADAHPAGAGACGWFDSSLDLRCGLAVSEMPEPDWTVLLLWFGPAALRASARLQ